MGSRAKRVLKESSWTDRADAKKSYQTRRKQVRRRQGLDRLAGLGQALAGLRTPVEGSRDRSLSGKARVKARKAEQRAERRTEE